METKRMKFLFERGYPKSVTAGAIWKPGIISQEVVGY